MPKKLLCTLSLILMLSLVLTSCDHHHVWYEAEIEKEATCKLTGSAIRACTKCDHIERIVVPAKGHTWGEWSVITAATCLTSGLKERICTVCFEKERQQISPRGYHYFSNWTTTQDATCTKEGLQERVCVCGEKETRAKQMEEHNYVRGVCSECKRGLVNIILPNVPMTLHSSFIGYYYGVKITSIQLGIKKQWNGKYDLSLYVSAEILYDKGSGDYARWFYANLYDSQGYLIFSANRSLGRISVGEKVKDKEVSLGGYIDLDPNETYTLVLLEDD